MKIRGGNTFFTLAIGSVLFYFLFRVVTTLQVLFGTYTIPDQLIVLLFFCSETFILMRAIGYFINVHLAETHTPTSPSFVSQATPAVTILIPTAGESTTVLQKTLTAARYVDYPNKRILLIDGNKDQSSSPAFALSQVYEDIDYFFVPEPRHGAKAGAINEALKQIRSPYIAILDADYRMGRNFLKRIIPKLEQDPAITFVQTPQFYGNISESLTSRAAQLQQTFFYEHISEGKSLSGAMFMCGTNLVIRTKPFRDIGGFVENSITEDFATSIKLIAAGHHGVYDGTTAAYGEGPPNLQEHFRQQYRWARGTVGTFLHNLPTLLNPASRFTLAQRWEYILSGTHYFVGPIWIILATLPVFYINFHVPVSFAQPIWYLTAYIPYATITLLFLFSTLLSRQYRRFDWLQAESLTFLTLPVYTKACIDALLGRKASFQVTKKEADVDTVPPLFWPLMSVFTAIYVFTLISGILQLFHPTVDRLSLAINVFWVLYHLYIAYNLPLRFAYAHKRNAHRS